MGGCAGSRARLGAQVQGVVQLRAGGHGPHRGGFVLLSSLTSSLVKMKEHRWALTPYKVSGFRLRAQPRDGDVLSIGVHQGGRGGGIRWRGAAVGKRILGQSTFSACFSCGRHDPRLPAESVPVPARL